MRKPPRFLGDIAGWIHQFITIQDENISELINFNRSFPALGVNNLTWAASIAIDPKVNPLNSYYCASVNADATVTAGNVGHSGRQIDFVLTNDGVSGRTVTFGTGFSPTATLVGTTSQTRTISFKEVNGTLWEIARTAAR